MTLELVLEPKDGLSKELIDFARRQVFNATSYTDVERREENRCPMLLPVTAVGVTEEGEPVGEVFEMVTRDISSASIGLFHEEPMQHEFIAIQLVIAETVVNILARVVWGRAMGPFHGSAATYVRKLDQFPTYIDR